MDWTAYTYSVQGAEQRPCCLGRDLSCEGCVLWAVLHSHVAFWDSALRVGALLGLGVEHF
jgi:hypothetical protein